MTGRPIKPILEQDADPQIALGRRAELRAQHKEARVKLGGRLAGSPEPGLARAEELYRVRAARTSTTNASGQRTPARSFLAHAIGGS
jgi:hypothetical protein